MGILNLISSGNYITCNRVIAQIFGLDEAIILGELASEYDYYSTNNQLDEEGYFYSTIENIEKNTTIKEKRQRAALNNLQSQGIIEIKRKGLPARRYIKINDDVLTPLLLNYNNQSSSLRTAISAELEQINSPTNNNKINNNELNNNKSIKKASKRNSFDEIITAYSTDEKTVDLLQEWLKVRKAKRAAMTDRAIQMNIDKLDNLAEQSGMSVNDYLSEVICRGWAAFYPISTYNNRQNGKTYGINGIAITDEKSDLDELF